MMTTKSRKVPASIAILLLATTGMMGGAWASNPAEDEDGYWEGREETEGQVPYSATVVQAVPLTGYEIPDPCNRIGDLITADWLEPEHYNSLIVPAGHLAIAPPGATYDRLSVMGGLLQVGDVNVSTELFVAPESVVATVDGDYARPPNQLGLPPATPPTQAAGSILVYGEMDIQGTLVTGNGIQPDPDAMLATGSFPSVLTYEGKPGAKGGSILLIGDKTLGASLEDACIMTGYGGPGGPACVDEVVVNASEVHYTGGFGGDGGDLYIPLTTTPSGALDSWGNVIGNGRIWLGSGGDGDDAIFNSAGLGDVVATGGDGGTSGWIRTPGSGTTLNDVAPNMLNEPRGGHGGDSKPSVNEGVNASPPCKNAVADQTSGTGQAACREADDAMIAANKLLAGTIGMDLNDVDAILVSLLPLFNGMCDGIDDPTLEALLDVHEQYLEAVSELLTLGFLVDTCFVELGATIEWADGQPFVNGSADTAEDPVATIQELSEVPECTTSLCIFPNYEPIDPSCYCLPSPADDGWVLVCGKPREEVGMHAAASAPFGGTSGVLYWVSVVYGGVVHWLTTGSTIGSQGPPAEDYCDDGANGDHGLPFKGVPGEDRFASEDVEPSSGHTRYHQTDARQGDDGADAQPAHAIGFATADAGDGGPGMFRGGDGGAAEALGCNGGSGGDAGDGGDGGNAPNHSQENCQTTTWTMESGTLESDTAGLGFGYEARYLNGTLYEYKSALEVWAEANPGQEPSDEVKMGLLVGASEKWIEQNQTEEVSGWQIHHGHRQDTWTSTSASYPVTHCAESVGYVSTGGDGGPGGDGGDGMDGSDATALGGHGGPGILMGGTGGSAESRAGNGGHGGLNGVSGRPGLGCQAGVSTADGTVGTKGTAGTPIAVGGDGGSYFVGSLPLWPAWGGTPTGTAPSGASAPHVGVDGTEPVPRTYTGPSTGQDICENAYSVHEFVYRNGFDVI